MKQYANADKDADHAGKIMRRHEAMWPMAEDAQLIKKRKAAKGEKKLQQKFTAQPSDSFPYSKKYLNREIMYFYLRMT